MSTCPFIEVAKKISAVAGLLSDSMLHSVSRWHLRLALIGSAIIGKNANGEVTPEIKRRNVITEALREIAVDAASTLFDYGVEDPAAAFVAEWERAAIKHPGMTLDADGPTDENRFYALAEEVGEVAASLTYDNKTSGGHGAVTQVGALALAWLVRYQEGTQA